MIREIARSERRCLDMLDQFVGHGYERAGGSHFIKLTYSMVEERWGYMTSQREADLLKDCEDLENRVTANEFNAVLENYREYYSAEMMNNAPVSLKTFQEYPSIIPPKYRWNLHTTERPEREPSYTLEKPHSAIFPALPGLKWEEIAMEFVSNYSMRVSARGVKRIYTFTEMGFKDGRKGDKPDSLWGVLRDDFAKNQGEISFNTPVAQKIRDQLKEYVKKIRKRLRSFMGIDDDPFYRYHSRKAYQTKFSLSDKRSLRR